MVALLGCWSLTTEEIFYHGILGTHRKREQFLHSLHTPVFLPGLLSVCSVCSVVALFGCWSLPTGEIFYHRILGIHGKSTGKLQRLTLVERLKANEATHSNGPIVEQLLIRLPTSLGISPLVEFHLIADRLAMLRGQVVQAQYHKPWR